MKSATLLALVALAALPGCQLIDQRTFRAKAVAPTAADLANAKLAPLPYVTIEMANPDADFRPALAEAVEAATARKADVEFDVLAPMPTAADQATQDVFTKNGAADTQSVAMAMGYDGVSLDRVHIGFRGEAGSPPRQVQIYLR